MVSLLIAALIWLPLVHLFFARDIDLYFSKDSPAPQARKLAARHMALWTDPKLGAEEIKIMRASNSEWDFMGRTFLVMALGNMSLMQPENQAPYLEVMDKIIDETIRLEQEKGMYHFLMDYAKDHDFVNQPPRSLFLDGEIALMLGVRQLIEPKQAYQPLLRERVDTMISYMRKSPLLSGESYPDECWTFCNCMALASITLSDVLDGRDHSDFCREWVLTAKQKLLDSQTGILISSFTVDGYAKDGPEGSTIWAVSHCLQLIDEDFARDQYRRARKQLTCSHLGFGYGLEWPPSWKGPRDIDSGTVIPILGISPSSSGLAFIAASAFNDNDFLEDLLTTLNLGGFPLENDTTLSFCASNQVGEAVILYAMTLGPLWQEIKDRQMPAGSP
ncbi:MAG: hypothetical protein JW860_06420 [Sedimentisphaerales bacterium]|nr:hypothetical protein [Sedimentisphaerales bacterium]